MKGNLIICLLITIPFLHGCAVFPNNEIFRISEIAPSCDSIKDRPVAYIDHKRFQILPNGKEIQQAISQDESENIVRYINSLNCFEDVIYDEYEKDKADINVTIKTLCIRDRYGPIKSVLGGLSLTLIPVPIKFKYSTSMMVLDKQGNKLFHYNNSDGYTMWLGLFMIPFGKKIPPSDQHYTSLLIKDCFVNFLN